MKAELFRFSDQHQTGFVNIQQLMMIQKQQIRLPRVKTF
jgi:hypothetical protein